ncbi:hypothetical protein G5I_10051 [Acromyrmex echinatior]|uniref:Uncharacterized protein n=1 Tax=Acromyrmex echinatior TaxID=103372 RepID=F4WVU8_ACREC|nr:hypothetical protein G5I_10051 [Acromyrmex echinatior]
MVGVSAPQGQGSWKGWEGNQRGGGSGGSGNGGSDSEALVDSENFCGVAEKIDFTLPKSFRSEKQSRFLEK